MIEHLFQLDFCLDWIIENQFTRIVLQFKAEDLRHSVEISNYLKEKYLQLRQDAELDQVDRPTIDIYVTQSKTCCVDLLVIQHVTDVQAVIHFGKVCLSQPAIKNLKTNPPILFVLSHTNQDQATSPGTINSIITQIESINSSDTDSKMCLIYDSNLVGYASEIEAILRDKPYKDNIHIAKLLLPSENWFTTRDHQSWLVTSAEPFGQKFCHYVIRDPISSYGCVLYLGERLSIQMLLSGPQKFYKFSCNPKLPVEEIRAMKILNKRMALVGRVKDEEDLKIGVIITNPLPDLNEVMAKLRIYAKARRHTLYFISMVQTIDEYKIGNFDLCDAFVVINSCNCSTILESLVFNRPILTELEFKLACGFEGQYGGVTWPGSSLHPSDDDLLIRRKVSDVSMALIQTRNELLERCSQSRMNKWSGMDYKSSDSNATGGESVTIDEGLKGIACTYESEPLDKDSENSTNNI